MNFIFPLWNILYCQLESEKCATPGFHIVENRTISKLGEIFSGVIARSQANAKTVDRALRQST